MQKKIEARVIRRGVLFSARGAYDDLGAKIWSSSLRITFRTVCF